jgi:ribonuclease P protein subunit POP4
MTPIKSKNIFRHELVGLNVEILKSSNSYHNSISGKVIDETQKTLLVKQGDIVKRIAKKGTLLKFMLPEGYVEMKGSILITRPEDRIKKKIKRRW